MSTNTRDNVQLAPNCLMIERVPVVVLLDENHDGTPDAKLWDFDGNGTTDMRQELARCRTVVFAPGKSPVPWTIPPTKTRFVQAGEVLSVTTHRVHVAAGVFEINDVPRPVSNFLTSLGQLWPSSVELACEAEAGRALWVELGGRGRLPVEGASK